MLRQVGHYGTRWDLWGFVPATATKRTYHEKLRNHVQPVPYHANAAYGRIAGKLGQWEQTCTKATNASSGTQCPLPGESDLPGISGKTATCRLPRQFGHSSRRARSRHVVGNRVYRIFHRKCVHWCRSGLKGTSWTTTTSCSKPSITRHWPQELTIRSQSGHTST